MARVLITGGAGFIGSHVVRRFIAAGSRTTVLDNFSSSSPTSIPEGVETIIGDVRSPDDVSRAIDGADICVHLAAVASVDICNTDYIESHRTNVTGFLTLVDCVRKHAPGCPIIYASSAAVYGDSTAMPATEATSPSPISPYGADKLSCELHAKAAAAVFGTASIGLRFFNVYGPGQDPRSPYSGVISRFLHGIRVGAVEVYGDGKQTRDFVFVGDVAEAIYRLAQGRITGAEVMNVCSENEVSVSELLEEMTKILQRTPSIVMKSPKAGDIKKSLGSGAKIRSVIGPFPFTPLSLGLAETLNVRDEPST